MRKNYIVRRGGILMPLFEVAIVEKPCEADGKVGWPEKLVFGPKAVVAVNAQAAAIAAVIDAKVETFDPHKSEVLVRPFV